MGSIGGHTAGPIMTKFGTHMRIDMGMVSKKLTPHPRGVVVEILRWSKNQKSGKCHELSRKSIQIGDPPNPGGSWEGGGWGQNFQKSGKFKELPRKSIKKMLAMGQRPKFHFLVPPLVAKASSDFQNR